PPACSPSTTRCCPRKGSPSRGAGGRRTGPKSVRDVRVGAAQFEHRDGDKPHNLARIDDLAGRAARHGAEIVSFHECSVTGYTFLRRLDRAALARLAEPVPGGPSTASLIEDARRHQIVIMA